MNAARIRQVTAADVARARETIARRLPPTPCLRSLPLEEALGRPLWLKCELFQVTGSFKPRGALNWLARAKPESLDRGLVAVSAGNHGMGLAWAAAGKAPVTVVMPEASSPYKIQACRDYGATVVLRSDIYAAWDHARDLVEKSGATLVPPYDDPDVIAGQGTVGLELLEQLPDVDVVLCPVGGGGLIAGIGVALKAARPNVRLVGVEPLGAPTLGRARAAGGPVTLERIDTMVSSLGASRAGDCCYALCRDVVDDLVTVDDAAIMAATRTLIVEGKLYAELGAALGLAALTAGAVCPPAEACVAVVVTGGNLETELLERVLAGP